MGRGEVRLECSGRLEWPWLIVVDTQPSCLMRAACVLLVPVYVLLQGSIR